MGGSEGPSLKRAALAASALAGLSIAPIPARPTAATRMRGVCWEGAGPVDRSRLAPLRELGVDWISQTPFGWCPSLAAPEVRLATTRVLWGETDAGLAETARLPPPGPGTLSPSIQDHLAEVTLQCFPNAQFPASQVVIVTKRG